MRLDNFDVSVTNSVQLAKELAISLNQQQIDPLYLLKVLVEQSEDIVPTILHMLGVNLAQLTKTIDEHIAQLPRIFDTGMQDPVLSGELQRILAESWSETEIFNDEFVGCIHVLLVMSESMDRAGIVLREFGATKEKLISALENRQHKKAHPVTHENKSSPILSRFGRDLVAAAKLNKLDQVIGRENEIRRLIDILMRRQKHNPLIVGEVGVGKTAVVRGLAHRIAANDVPTFLLNRQIISLDLRTLIAKSKLLSSPLNQLELLISELETAQEHIILFLDELHILTHHEASDQTKEIFNQLKPALLSGELYCIAAVTSAEYHSSIAENPFFEKCFQKAIVAEPLVDETMNILRNLKENYEVHHGVIIEQDVVKAAVVLSHRYLKNRFFPAKAIDLIDEAAARRRVQIDSYPLCLAEIDQSISQLEIERQKVIRQKTKTTAKLLQKTENEIALLAKELSKLKDQWRNEKETVEIICRLKKEILATKIQAQKAEREQKPAEAASLRFNQLPQLEEDFQEITLKLRKIQKKKQMLRITLIEEDIAEVLANWTGTPSWLMC